MSNQSASWSTASLSSALHARGDQSRVATRGHVMRAEGGGPFPGRILQSPEQSVCGISHARLDQRTRWRRQVLHLISPMCEAVHMETLTERGRYKKRRKRCFSLSPPLAFALHIATGGEDAYYVSTLRAGVEEEC
jgi:hypothetical protein